MSVDLEKIAGMLESAHETITNLENENEELQSKVDGLSHLDNLEKEASAQHTEWDNSGMGDVSTTPMMDNSNGENRLDSFLND